MFFLYEQLSGKLFNFIHIYIIFYMIKSLFKTAAIICLVPFSVYDKNIMKSHYIIGTTTYILKCVLIA